MKHRTDTFVIVPNWNGQDYLADCLESLEAQTYKPSIIVVDNGSTDESLSIVEEKFPQVELIKLAQNHGFAGGVNAGIKKALNSGAVYIALFNNDAVADPSWLEQLVGVASEKSGIGIVCGKLMQMDKKHFDSAGEMLQTNGMPHPRGRGEQDKGQYDKGEYVFAASGGASLYRASMLEKIGLFDEDFFAYFEDVDISFRAQLAGWKVWYEPSAVAYHHIGKTSSRMPGFIRYHSIKNFIYLYNKNMPGYLLFKYKPLFFLQLTRMKLGSIRDGQLWEFTKAFFRTFFHILRTLAKRRAIQKSRVVSISYIDEMLYHGKIKKVAK
jgi:GT2 family glycosyltransferase